MSIERETRWGVQILRDKVGKMEIWETVKLVKNGQVRRKVGERLDMDGATYEIVKVSESNAVAKAITKKKVEYITDDGVKVSYMASPTKTIYISTYRDKE